MTDLNWAICALRDIQNALDSEKYETASHHIDDAIKSILSVDEGSVEGSSLKRFGRFKHYSTRL